MAPRRRRTSPGEGAADAGSPGFQQLPDEVLVRILGCLNQKDRHRAALVSHRWHDCAHAPELCRQVRMDSLWRTSRFGPWSHSVASLTAWLMRHGRHVRHMQLGGFHAKIESQEEQAQLACCLMACAGGQLETLRAAIDGLVVAAWAPAAVRSLRELQLGFAASELQISNSLHSLTQLTLLVLAGRPVRFAAGARLPASLQRLRLLDGSSSSLPAQLVGLSQLEGLCIQFGNHTGVGYSSITCLSALTRLELHDTSHLPACLGQLTGLKALVLNRAARADEHDNEQQAGAALNAALGPLTQLTSLLLFDLATPSDLPALAGLSHLQRAYFNACRGLDSLPAGPWCSSLQLLAASPDYVLCSSDFLASAGQLQEVVLQGECSEQLCPMLQQWAATHPPLRRLRFLMGGSVPAALLGSALRLQRERPQLDVTHEPSLHCFPLFAQPFTLPNLQD